MAKYWMFAVFWAILITVQAVEPDHAGRMSQQIFHGTAELSRKLVGLLPGVAGQLGGRVVRLYLPVKAPEGSQCRADSEYTLQAIMQADNWALKMFDASTKLPPGLMDGSTWDLGDWDQCLRVSAPEHKFKGQLCVLLCNSSLPLEIQNYFAGPMMTTLLPENFVLISLCVPSSCSPEDVTVHVTETLHAANIDLRLDGLHCFNGEPLPLRTKDVVLVVIFVTIMLLVAMSTWYDSQRSKTKSDLLIAFSLTSNWRELSDTRSKTDIPCLNGLRIFCSIWMVLTHRIVQCIVLPYVNYTSYRQARQGIMLPLLSTSTLATEVFFLMSGLVRGYSFLQQRHQGRPLKLLQQYVHRYFRITPPLGVMVLCWMTLSSHLGDGPMVEAIAGYHEDCCDALWWTNLLHISNIVYPQFICKAESWYLAVDFHLFLFSPLLLSPLYRRPKLGVMLLIAAFTISTIAKVASAAIFDIYPDIVAMNRSSSHSGAVRSSAFGFHFNTVYRAGTYIVGLGLAFIFIEAKLHWKKINLSKVTVILSWVLSLAVIVAVLYWQVLFINRDFEAPTWEAVLYFGVGQRVWVLAWAWVILACSWGYGGWLNTMLSWPQLLPLSKLTFGIFLIHMNVIFFSTTHSRQPIDFSSFQIVYLGVADLMVTCALAVVLYLTVEAPVYRVVASLLRGGRGGSSQTSNKTVAAGRLNETKDININAPTHLRGQQDAKRQKEKKKEK